MLIKHKRRLDDNCKKFSQVTLCGHFIPNENEKPKDNIITLNDNNGTYFVDTTKHKTYTQWKHVNCKDCLKNKTQR